VSEQLGGLYKTTVVFYTSHPATGMDIADLIRALHRGEAFSPSETVRPVLVPLPGGDPDWNEARFAGQGEKIPILLLCDHCFEKVTGKFAECQPGCLSAGPLGPDDSGEPDDLPPDYDRPGDDEDVREHELRFWGCRMPNGIMAVCMPCGYHELLGDGITLAAITEKTKGHQ
jgi:hypothetical protein